MQIFSLYRYVISLLLSLGNIFLFSLAREQKNNNPKDNITIFLIHFNIFHKYNEYHNKHNSQFDMKHRMLH